MGVSGTVEMETGCIGVAFTIDRGKKEYGDEGCCSLALTVDRGRGDSGGVDRLLQPRCRRGWG